MVPSFINCGEQRLSLIKKIEREKRRRGGAPCNPGVQSEEGRRLGRLVLSSGFGSIRRYGCLGCGVILSSNLVYWLIQPQTSPVPSARAIPPERLDCSHFVRLPTDCPHPARGSSTPPPPTDSARPFLSTLSHPTKTDGILLRECANHGRPAFCVRTSRGRVRCELPSAPRHLPLRASPADSTAASPESCMMH